MLSICCVRDFLEVASTLRERRLERYWELLLLKVNGTLPLPKSKIDVKENYNTGHLKWTHHLNVGRLWLLQCGQSENHLFQGIHTFCPLSYSAKGNCEIAGEDGWITDTLREYGRNRRRNGYYVGKSTGRTVLVNIQRTGQHASGLCWIQQFEVSCIMQNRNAAWVSLDLYCNVHESVLHLVKMMGQSQEISDLCSIRNMWDWMFFKYLWVYLKIAAEHFNVCSAISTLNFTVKTKWNVC